MRAPNHRKALELARRSEDAVSEIGAFCHRHGIDAQFRLKGWLWAATNLEQLDAWKAMVEAVEATGAQPFATKGASGSSSARRCRSCAEGNGRPS